MYTVLIIAAIVFLVFGVIKTLNPPLCTKQNPCELCRR